MTTLHGTDITLVGNDRSYLPITRFGIEQSDAVTAVSQYLKQRTIDEFQIHRPISVIPNFVNCDVYSRSDGSRRFAGDLPRTMRPSSYTFPTSDLSSASKTWLQSLRASPQECPAKLLLVGDGPERPKAEWLAETQGVSQDVLFLGKQSDMAPFLSVADILLLPSENESFRSGSTGGYGLRSTCHCNMYRWTSRKLLNTRKTDSCWPWAMLQEWPTPASSWSRTLSLRNEMGRAARQHALRDFCATKIVRHYEQLYLQTIEESSRKA